MMSLALFPFVVYFILQRHELIWKVDFPIICYLWDLYDGNIVVDNVIAVVVDNVIDVESAVVGKGLSGGRRSRSGG